MGDEKTAKLCMPCENRQIAEPATHWCSDCSLSVCDKCLENHNLLKTNHHIITCEVQALVNSLCIPFSEYCIDHSRESDLYCPTHDYLVCIICAQTNHSECKPAVPIAEVSLNSKESTLKEKLEQEIDGVIKKLEDGIQKRNINKQNIDQQKEDILNQIANTRKLIESKLNKFEEEIIKSLKEKHSLCEEVITNLESQLEEHRQDFLKIKDSFSVLMTHASKVQTFIGLRSLSKTMLENNEALQLTTPKIRSFELIMVPNEEIHSRCDSIKSYGKIAVEQKENNSEYVGGNVVEAPTISQKSVLENKTTIRLPKDLWTSNCVKSCAILPNEKLVFLDKAFRRLVTIYKNGKIANTVRLKGEPFDVAVITSQLGVKVAVTFPWSKPSRIDIMYIDDFKPVESTTFNGMCCGVTYNSSSDNVLVIVKRIGVVILDTSCTVVNILPISTSEFFFLHYSDDKLYFSDEYNGHVVVYDLFGQEILKLKGVPSPRALSSDDSGYLLVSCSKMNQVLRLKKNGDHKTKVLGEKDGLQKPSGIYFSKETQQVLVCNEINGQAFLYSVRKQRLEPSESFHEVQKVDSN